MQRQGILNKIVALIALLVLVLPASVCVASCMKAAKGSACCMSQVTPKAKEAPKEVLHGCCNAKEKLSPSGPQLSEGKKSCHCFKSFPAQLPNDLNTKFSPTIDEVVLPTPGIVTPKVQPSSKPNQPIFGCDLPPPTEPPSSIHSGRAPPASVI